MTEGRERKRGELPFGPKLGLFLKNKLCTIRQRFLQGVFLIDCCTSFKTISHVVCGWLFAKIEKKKKYISSCCDFFCRLPWKRFILITNAFAFSQAQTGDYYYFFFFKKLQRLKLGGGGKQGRTNRIEEFFETLQRQ